MHQDLLNPFCQGLRDWWETGSKLYTPCYKKKTPLDSEILGKERIGQETHNQSRRTRIQETWWLRLSMENILRSTPPTAKFLDLTRTHLWFSTLTSFHRWFIVCFGGCLLGRGKEAWIESILIYGLFYMLTWDQRLAKPMPRWWHVCTTFLHPRQPIKCW